MTRSFSGLEGSLSALKGYVGVEVSCGMEKKNKNKNKTGPKTKIGLTMETRKSLLHCFVV
jgi:hypothetical protein